LNGPTEIEDKFRWYELIKVYIDELRMTEKEVYKMNYIHSLNWLSYFYQRNKVEETKLKQKV
jgi:hypothetical protein